MRYAETETDSAVDVTDPLPAHYAPENMHRLAGMTGSLTGIMRRVTRCAIAALVSAVIILSWQIYAYQQIIRLMHKTVDQQNILLDNAMGTHMSHVARTAPATAYKDGTIHPMNTVETNLKPL